MPQPDRVDKSHQPRYLALAFVLPMVVYMLLGSLEPTPSEVREAAPMAVEQPGAPSDQEANPAGPPGEGAIPEELLVEDFPEPVEPNWLGLAIPGSYYPLFYTLKVVVTLGVLAWFWPAYRQFPWRVSPLAVAVGVVGVVLWIGLSNLGLEQRMHDWLAHRLGPDNLISSLLGGGGRAAYNPLAALEGQGTLAYAFLAVRFLGLALMVPIIEEAFIRAFLMRYVMHENWTEIPFGVVNRTAVVVGILLPVLYHPEMLAALVWFSLVTWLMVRTKNFWDCVVAHATTNLLLGVYVVFAGAWELW